MSIVSDLTSSFGVASSDLKQIGGMVIAVYVVVFVVNIIRLFFNAKKKREAEQIKLERENLKFELDKVRLRLEQIKLEKEEELIKVRKLEQLAVMNAATITNGVDDPIIRFEELEIEEEQNQTLEAEINAILAEMEANEYGAGF